MSDAKKFLEGKIGVDEFVGGVASSSAFSEEVELSNKDFEVLSPGTHQSIDKPETAVAVDGNLTVNGDLKAELVAVDGNLTVNGAVNEDVEGPSGVLLANGDIYVQKFHRSLGTVKADGNITIEHAGGFSRVLATGDINIHADKFTTGTAIRRIECGGNFTVSGDNITTRSRSNIAGDLNSEVDDFQFNADTNIAGGVFASGAVRNYDDTLTIGGDVRVKSLVNGGDTFISGSADCDYLRHSPTKRKLKCNGGIRVSGKLKSKGQVISPVIEAEELDLSYNGELIRENPGVSAPSVSINVNTQVNGALSAAL